MSDSLGPYKHFAFLRISVSLCLPLLGLYAVTFGALAYTGGYTTHLATSLALTVPFIWLSVRDLQEFELPDLGTGLVAVVAIVHTCIFAPADLLSHVATGALTTAVLWGVGELYFRKAGHEGLGIGDAKLFGAGVLLLGPWHLPDLFFLSSLGGLIGYWLNKQSSAENSAPSGIPFGPYIAYAIYVLSFLDPIFL